jgi:glycosyltransferase 2 family protein
LDKKVKQKRILTTLIKVLVSGGLILWLLLRIGITQIFQQLTSANLWWIGTSILAFVLSNFIGSFQWFLLLKSKKLKITFPQALNYYHVGLFFNNFLIGNVGGDAFRIYDVTKKTNDSTNAITTVFFDRFIGFFTLTFMAMIVSLVWLQQIASINTVYTIAIILVGWVLALLFLFNEAMAKRVSVLLNRLLPQVVNSKLRELYIEINQFRHDKQLLFHLFFISIFVQILRVFTHVFAAWSVGVQTDVIFFFVFIPIVAMAASLPISFGGIGVREQSGVSLFSQVGVAANSVVVFEFLAYIVGIISALPGGILFILRKGEAKQELSQVRKMTHKQNR